jgi:hypothetical protein
MHSYELIIGYKNGYLQEQLAFNNRTFNGYWWGYFTLMSVPILASLLFWNKKIRKSIAWTMAVCLLANIVIILEKIMLLLSWVGRALSI